MSEALLIVLKPDVKCVRVWPKETSPTSRSALEVTLIVLYDVCAHVAILAHGPLPALLAVADGHLSR